MICAGGEVDYVSPQPPPSRDPGVRPPAPHSPLPSKSQNSKCLVFRDPKFRASGLSFCRPRCPGSLHSLRGLTQESGISGPSFPRPTGPSTRPSFILGLGELVPARPPPNSGFQPSSAPSPLLPRTQEPKRSQTLTSPSAQRAFSRAKTSAAFS